MHIQSQASDLKARVPDFLTLGTQKGGTTTLHHLLSQHPQVFLPACKEVHYFSLHSLRGMAWYADHFRSARPDQRCGDITPYYLFHPQAPLRIETALPTARLLVLLRDPVERALSHYFHARRHGFETLPLAEALRAEPDRLQGAEAALAPSGGHHYSHQKHSYVARGHYEQQIQAYRQRFPDRQILVLQSELLFAEPEHCWQAVLSFLGLDSWPLPPIQAANRGMGEAHGVADSVRVQLRRHFADTVAFVSSTYGFDWGW
jgi:hypothetical protein